MEPIGDILSFANTVHSKNCYLIFGVVEKTLEVIGKGKIPIEKIFNKLLTHQKLTGDPQKLK